MCGQHLIPIRIPFNLYHIHIVETIFMENIMDKLTNFIKRINKYVIHDTPHFQIIQNHFNAFCSQ